LATITALEEEVVDDEEEEVVDDEDDIMNLGTGEEDDGNEYVLGVENRI
jgi:uncharacterized protein YgfB (UPF0149 family)